MSPLRKLTRVCIVTNNPDEIIRTITEELDDIDIIENINDYSAKDKAVIVREVLSRQKLLHLCKHIPFKEGSLLICVVDGFDSKTYGLARLYDSVIDCRNKILSPFTDDDIRLDKLDIINIIRWNISRNGKIFTDKVNYDPNLKY